jgi:hypothetical protein
MLAFVLTLFITTVAVLSSPHVNVLSIVTVCADCIRTRSPSTGTDAPPSQVDGADANPDAIEYLFAIIYLLSYLGYAVGLGHDINLKNSIKIYEPTKANSRRISRGKLALVI